MTITLQPIGVIHSPFTEPEGMPIQPAGAGDTPGRVEVFAPFREGLADLEGFSHVVLLYWFHRSEGFDLRVVPFLDDVPRGVFATRAPRRPNPIGLSVVRLDGVDDGVLRVRGVDVLDGTPLLDVKPYIPETAAPGAVRLGWLERARAALAERRADDRFVRGTRPAPGDGPADRRPDGPTDGPLDGATDRPEPGDGGRPDGA